MISNTSPLILLPKLKILSLLKELFGEILIPDEVKEELLMEDKSGYREITRAIEEGWIKIANPKLNRNLNLGKGENAAINLALEKKDSIIIDDKEAIKILESLNIDYQRTTSVIFTAVSKRIINKKEALRLINELIANGYFITTEIYIKLLDSLK